MKLNAFVPLLLGRFPDGAFTPDSLEYVAAKCDKGFPTYAEVVNHLSDWWRPKKPELVAITPPPPPPPEIREPLTPEQTAALDATLKGVYASLKRSAANKQASQLALMPEDLRPRPKYLSPGLLDQLNPLPNGRKRTGMRIPGAAWSPPANDRDEPPGAA